MLVLPLARSRRLWDCAQHRLSILLQQIVFALPGRIHESADPLHASRSDLPFSVVLQRAVVVASDYLRVTERREPLQALGCVIQIPVRDDHLAGQTFPRTTQ